MTAYYAMVMRGRVSKGKRVLIHSGTGAVGMAAIQICLTRGAEVKPLSPFLFTLPDRCQHPPPLPKKSAVFMESGPAWIVCHSPHS